MATLESVSGASFVPNLASAFRTGVEGFEKIKEQEEAAQQKQDILTEIDTITRAGEDPKAVQRARIRLAALDQNIAQAVTATIESGDKAAIARVQQEASRGLRTAKFVLSKKDIFDRKAAFGEAIADKISKGLDVSQDLKTMDLEEDEFNNKMERMIIAGTDIKTIMAEQFIPIPGGQVSERSGKRIADPTLPKPQEPFTLGPGQQRFPSGGGEAIAAVSVTPPKPTATFEPVFAEDGTTIIGQRNLQTGEVKSDPRTIKDTTLIQNLKAIGVDPDTEEGKKLILEILKKPRVKIDINKENEGLFKTPQGFMLLDADDPTKGVTPIPGGPKDAVSAENAGRSQMLRTAQKAAKGMAALVFTKVNKDGTIPDDAEIDRVNLVNAQLGTPGTQGRDLRNKMEFGIQAITRIETGAAMPDSEVDNTRQRFMPHPLDSKKIIRLKLAMFDDFLGGALKLLDPTGRFDVERFQVEFDKRLQESEPTKRKKFNPKTGRVE